MKDDTKLIILASCEAVSPLKDKGWSIRFHTNEPTKSQVESILNSHNDFGVLVFVGGKNQLSDSEIEEIDSIDVDLYDQKKSQAQRLRGALYRWFEQSELKGHESVEVKKEMWRHFYKIQTEKLINHFKNKLEP